MERPERIMCFYVVSVEQECMSMHVSARGHGLQSTNSRCVYTLRLLALKPTLMAIVADWKQQACYEQQWQSSRPRNFNF
jgi:hypothetical protein